jgi:tetratricopeptide (TPR) repeat protein
MPRLAPSAVSRLLGRDLGSYHYRMPLLVLPAEEAIRRAENPAARWPETPGTQAQRLDPVAQPDFTPSFRIDKAQPIFTIGSCFARNIEKQLLLEGYNVAMAHFSPPPEPGARADPDALLHRYLVHAIGNELRWALDPLASFPEASFIELEPGGWFDLNLHQAAPPSPIELVKARRKAIADYMRLAAEARLVVITLGLAEAWFDTATGHYINAVPPQRARQLFPTRFQFHLLDYSDVLDELEQVLALLTAHGHPDLKILITVSPVAMNTTFTGGEVLVANTYMKSVQRAAVEALVRGHDNVDYFPSYESVILSDRRRAWREDGAHVSDELVRLNVLRMLEAYGEDGARPEKADRSISAFAFAQAARDALEAGQTKAAMTAYRAAVQDGPEEGLILMEFGRFLLGLRRFAEAAKLAEASVRHGSGGYGGHWLHAQALYGLRRYTEADAAAAQARAVQPSHPGVINVSANIARKLGRLEEALDFADRHQEVAPDARGSRRRRDELARKLEQRRKGGVLSRLLSPKTGKT